MECFRLRQVWIRKKRKTLYGTKDGIREYSKLTFEHRYIDYALRDESLTEVYGENVSRLQGIKKVWDPHNRFNQFFPLLGTATIIE